MRSSLMETLDWRKDPEENFIYRRPQINSVCWHRYSSLAVVCSWSHAGRAIQTQLQSRPRSALLALLLNVLAPLSGMLMATSAD
jgi:hypothetical protein